MDASLFNTRLLGVVVGLPGIGRDEGATARYAMLAALGVRRTISHLAGLAQNQNLPASLPQSARVFVRAGAHLWFSSSLHFFVRHLTCLASIRVWLTAATRHRSTVLASRPRRGPDQSGPSNILSVESWPAQQRTFRDQFETNLPPQHRIAINNHYASCLRVIGPSDATSKYNMSRTRSLSFPRLNTSQLSEDAMGPFLPSPTHSRDSSGESEYSFPPTPTFSSRGHNRYPSSTSSLVTNPDSPANPQKTTLHDLVEEPAERDDQQWDFVESRRDSLCICDTPFCHHRERESSPHGSASIAELEWIPGDDYFDGGYLPGGEREAKRRKSNENMTDSFTSRLSHHFSKRFGGHKSNGSVSTVNLRSAPASRSSSLRLPSTRSFTAPNAREMRIASTPQTPAMRPSFHDQPATPQRSRALSSITSRPVDISIPEPEDDACERQELATTPLLPPMMTNYFSDSQEALRSPLTSPSVASPSVVPSMANTPVSTPITRGFPTPPLSTKGSAASINKRSSHVLQPASEIPHLAIAEETDRWAIKLGHANFHIYPEPYLPEVCDAQNCRQLRDDWESARVEFMRQAARVSDNHGITSQIYKLTEEKWAEIDATWRANYEMANAQARASGENPVVQPLAETQALQKMPSLQDPTQPSKFPVVEEADIVGPMVQYAKIQHRRQPSKKSSFLKIFTDPASLLGKPTFGLQR